MLVKLNSIQPVSVYQEIILSLQKFGVNQSFQVYLAVTHSPNRVTTKKPLGKFFLETSVSWLPLIEVKSNQCCGKYCTAHGNIIKTIGKIAKQTNPKQPKNLPTKLLRRRRKKQKQTDLNLEIINYTNQCSIALT